MADANQPDSAGAPGHDEELAAFAADPELAGMFVAEALDHLGTIEATILQLEAAPADVKLLNDVFRPFHTVKGNAGVLGVTSVQELAHKRRDACSISPAPASIAMGPARSTSCSRRVDLLTLMIDELPARVAGKPATDVSTRRRDADGRASTR